MQSVVASRARGYLSAEFVKRPALHMHELTKQQLLSGESSYFDQVVEVHSRPTDLHTDEAETPPQNFLESQLIVRNHRNGSQPRLVSDPVPVRCSEDARTLRITSTCFPVFYSKWSVAQAENE